MAHLQNSAKQRGANQLNLLALRFIMPELCYTNVCLLRLENPDEAVGEDYPIDIWLLLAAYIRPEDTVTFSLICRKAWTVTCTAAFWTRLYRRCDHEEFVNILYGVCACPAVSGQNLLQSY